MKACRSFTSLYGPCLWLSAAIVRGLTQIQNDSCCKCVLRLGDQQAGNRSWRVHMSTSSDLQNLEKGIFSLK